MRSNLLRPRFILGLLIAGLTTASVWALPYQGILSNPFPSGLYGPFFEIEFDLRIGLFVPGPQTDAAQSTSSPMSGSVQVVNQPDSDFDGVFTSDVTSLNLSGGGV